MGAIRSRIPAGLGGPGRAGGPSARPPYRARGFTLLELSVALFVLATLSALAGVTYLTVSGGVERLSAAPSIALVQLDARRLVTSDVPLAYPPTIVGTLVCTPPGCPPGVVVTADQSPSPDVVSLYRYSSTELVLAAGSSGGCLVLVDRLNAPPSWLWDPDLLQCSAAEVAAAAVSSEGGSASDPAQVVLS